MKKLLIIGLVLAVVSCTTKPNKEELEQVKDLEKFDETTKALNERFDAIYNMVPISELSAYLESVNADYNSSFINDPGAASKYLTSPEQAALALGVYYMDLHYAAAYQKSDQTAAIYDAMAVLADSIGMGRVFNQAILADFEEQLADNPTAKKFVEDALVEGSKKLNTSDRPRLAAFIMTGVVIERLYLLTSIINDARDKSDLAEEELNLMITPLMKAIANQKENVDVMVEAVNLVRTSEEGGAGFSMLFRLQRDYENLEAKKEEIDATEAVNPDVLSDIFISAMDLREQIVSTEE